MLLRVLLLGGALWILVVSLRSFWAWGVWWVCDLLEFCGGGYLDFVVWCLEGWFCAL